MPSDGLSSGDDSSGGSGSGNGDESDSGSGETVYVTLGPTTTVFFSDGTSGVSTDGPILSDGASQQTLVTDGSPAASEVSANSPATATDVNPFTTVTIDIWGTGTSSSENNSPTATTSNTGSESSSGSGSDAADAPQYTSPGQSSADSSPGESPSGSPSEDSSHGNSDGSEEPSADVKSSNDNSQASITITFGGPSGFTYHPSEQNTDAGPTAYGSLDSSGLVPGNDAPLQLSMLDKALREAHHGTPSSLMSMSIGSLVQTAPARSLLFPFTLLPSVALQQKALGYLLVMSTTVVVTLLLALMARQQSSLAQRVALEMDPLLRLRPHCLTMEAKPFPLSCRALKISPPRCQLIFLARGPALYPKVTIPTRSFKLQPQVTL